MFQKSLLRNFVKSFNAPDFSDIMKLVTKTKFIAEDANGAEYIGLLAKMLYWTNCIREVKNTTDMKKADGVIYDKNNNPIENNKKLSKKEIFESANKLLDRFIFILFAEDRRLVSANRIEGY